MSVQPSLRFDDSFVEDCKQSTVPDDVLELGRCYHCQHIAKLSGGLCEECADPLPDEDDEEAKAPAVTSSGVIQTGAGQDRLAIRG